MENSEASAVVQPEYTLLVVDDNELNRDMLTRRLERNGFRVLAADDGQPALDLIRDEVIDLVLLDIMMPGMDGLEVLRRVRQTRTQSELPIIMATARGESRDVVHALELGANDYVIKPLDFPVVLARIQAQLRTATSSRPRLAEAPSLAEIRPGIVLGGRYRLAERIGKGSYGSVYRARHLELDLDVAVKILQTNLTADEEALARFRREGVSTCRVQHPNAVTVFDFEVTTSGVAYLVMELLLGTSLAQELLEHKRLSVERAIAIAQPIAEVLREAHAAGIVHRDVKPENVFLQRTRHGEVVKVLDFGIAKLIGESVTEHHLTIEGSIFGTPAYMAPERFRSEPYDGRSDIYSLGVMFFEMLTGRLPFISKSGDPVSLMMMHLEQKFPPLRSVDPSLPDELEDLVERAVSKKVSRRPDAAAFLNELSRLRRRPGIGEPAPLPRPHRRSDASRSEVPWIDLEAATTELRPAPRETFVGRLLGRLRRTLGSDS